MKHTINIIILCLLLSTVLWSQIPNKISYQGLLTTVSGPVNDGSYTLKFDVYNAPSSGTLRHTETFSGVSVQQGTFSVMIGSTVTLPAIFSESLYVEITATSGPSGLNYPLALSPRSALTASPYSLAPWATSDSNVFYKGGNVGIGTTAPTQTLHLERTGANFINFTESGTHRGMIGISTGAYSGLVEANDNDFIIRGGNSIIFGDDAGYEKMRIMNGNVGIGTTAPGAKLHVSGGTVLLDNPYSLQTKDDAGTVQNVLGTASDGTVELNGFHGTSMMKGVNGATYIYGSGSPTTLGMTVNTSGNVGIGTANPADKLEAVGTIRASVGSGSSAFKIYNTDVGKWWSFYPSTNGSATDLGLFQSGTITPQVIFKSSGNVGIGTGAPAAKLHLSVNATDAYQGLGITSTVSGGKVLTINQGTPGMLTFTEPDIADLVTMDFNTQRVGIGRTDPISRLHVHGDINTDGIVYSYGVALISDKQFKKDIVTLSSALEKIQSMRGVYFTWRSDEYPDRSFSKDRQIGFIAQEVEEIVPELVSIMPDGYKSVDYSKVTPLLVEAIQEQQKEIDELKSLVKSLLAGKSNSTEGGTR